ncbi:MAG TPA: helix-turn-helix transcriptional regulator [Casimicrobiaceae bacterium]|nr:helix-turn-helix transcriptional regulator [Casimicrobiaceae bacterium]
MPARNKTTGARTKVAGKPPRKRKGAPPAIAPARTPARTADGDAGVIGLARQLRAWADSVLGVAGAAADISIGAAKALLVKPGQQAALAKAGAMLRRMREAAGLSLKEVTDAIDLEDPVLLELVENGKIALPFEIVLRLASVLGRNDPLSFVMRFTRSYNPDVWRTLERLGFGRLVVQAGREREFANIYRGSDAARRLSDEDFAAVLAFTKKAFELALAFRGGNAPGARRARPVK